MNPLLSRKLSLEVATVFLLAPLIIVYLLLRLIYESIFKQKTPKNIMGEIAVVTGGGNGLGREICFALAAKGCHVAVVDIDEVGAKKTVELLHNNYKVKSKAYKVDVGNHDEVMQLSKNVANDLGDVTILINNAGILYFSSYPPHWQAVQNMLNVNLGAHLWTIEAFLPKMKKLKKGHIVAISSVSALYPLVQFSVYTATKCGVRGLMRALRLELRQAKYGNIHTTTIMPFVLNSNPKAARIFTKSGYSKDYPLIHSDCAAKTTVNAMLLNKKEATLPPVLGFLHPLYEMLPSSLQDSFNYMKTKNLTQDIMG